MLALTHRPIASAVAAVGIAIGAAWDDAAAQNPAAQNPLAQSPLIDARDIRTALRACWIAPGEGAARQVSVRLGFNRDGEVVGQPLITYENPQPTEEGRAAVREALAQALARCVPLPLSDAFRNVIAVHPITVRLGEWPRRPSRRP